MHSTRHLYCARLVARILAIAAILVPAAGTLLSLLRHPHWIFRLWDFPRVQMAVVALAGVAAYASFFFDGTELEVAMLVAGSGAIAWQLYKIHPYTMLAPKQVKSARPSADRSNGLSLLIANVQMENEDRHRLISLVRERNPDVVLTVETSHEWVEGLERGFDDYPHRVKHPQDNYYGMALFSKLEIKRAQIAFLVQDDIPSIHAAVRLRSGVEVELHALHPRPPEPIRDQKSTPRDAELVVLGRRIEKEKKDVPTVVAGDLNDVAWSETSQLFVRLSGLLDPRVGRGFFNSFNARNPLARFPLDHVFHSNHFKLLDLRRERSIGSDHFPIYADLLYEPEAAAEQERSRKKPGDEKQASERLEKQREDAANGDDRPSRT